MATRFSDVMTRGDWIKLGLLVVIAGILWGWVYIEFRKPFPGDVASAQITQSRPQR